MFPHLFIPWYKAFTVAKEELWSVDKDSGIVLTSTTPVLEVEPIHVLYTLTPGFYNTDPSRVSLFHTSVTECAIHVW